MSELLQSDIETTLFCNYAEVGKDEQKRQNIDRVTLAKFLKDENISPETIIHQSSVNEGQFLLMDDKTGLHKWILKTTVYLKLARPVSIDKKPILGWYKKVS